MNESTTSEKAEANRLQPGAVVAGIVLATFVLAFLATGWIRTRQSDETATFSSEIEALAKHHEPLDPLVESRERGQEVYQRYCAICHGDDGAGNGFNAAMLDTPPRNFADAGFWNGATEERVSRAIRDGGKSVDKSVLMPAWGRTLSERQMTDVAAFLKTLPSLADSPAAETE